MSPRLLDSPFDRPRAVLAVAALAVASLAPGWAHLEVALDGRALVPRDAREAASDARVRARFDLRDPIAVVLETDDPAGIYTASLLRRVADVSARLQALDGVRPGDVTSLATESSDRVAPGTLEFRPWLSPMPESESELAELRRGIAGAGIYRGTLVSDDARTSAASILVGVPPGADRVAFVRRVREVASRAADSAEEGAGAQSVRIHVAGAPVAESELGGHLLRDLARSLPAVVATLALAFLVLFRSALAACLPLLEVAGALVALGGILGYSSTPIYLTLAIVPVVLTAVGTSDELHVLACLRRHARASPSLERRELVRSAWREMRRAVSVTSLTTALGFACFLASPIGPVRAFGATMALGVLVCLAFTLFVAPAMLVALPDRAVEPLLARSSGAGGAARAAQPEARLGARLAALVELALARRRTVAAAFAVIALASLGAASRVRVEDSWVDGFAPESELRRAAARVDELFGGAHVLHAALSAERVVAAGTLPRSALDADGLDGVPRIDVDPGHWIGHRLHVRARGAEAPGPGAIELPAHVAAVEPGSDGALLVRLQPARVAQHAWVAKDAAEIDWRIDGEGRAVDPSILARIGELERRIAELDGVGRVLGPHEHLSTMAYFLRGRAEEGRRVPATHEEMASVLAHYERVRGAERLRGVLANGGRDALVTLYLEGASFASTARLLAEVRALESELLAPLGVRVELAGDVALSQAMIAGIVETETRSLALALAVVVAAAALFLGSLRDGCIAALPPLFAALAVFGVMGATGMPLGVATSMFAAMTLGIGVDHAVHLILARRRARAAGHAGAAATREAVRAAGPALAIDALAVAAAFAWLASSSVPANARLGQVMVVAMAACLAFALLAVPLLLERGGRVRAAPPGSRLAT